MMVNDVENSGCRYAISFGKGPGTMPLNALFVLFAYFYNILFSQLVFPAIHLLLSPGGPSAIFRRIITVIVNAINRIVITWGASHIMKKIIKRIKPPVTYRDTTTAPIGVTGTLGISTPLLHRRPYSIDSGALASIKVRFTMYENRTRAALCAFPARKVANLHKRFVTTFTTTKPPVFFAALWTLFNNGPFPKCFSRQIKFFHSVYYNTELGYLP